jgi:hypothetical protein
MRKTKIKWLAAPQKHDYSAARSYLSLVVHSREAKRLVDKLKQADIEAFAAKDIFRASTLPLLDGSDSHVRKYRALIARKESLSPILLCRDPGLARLIVADGYHRLCAVYTFDEDAMIPCQIV